MTLPDQARPISAQALLLDIEGTTTPLAFVKEVLFPYARERLPRFVAERRQDPAVARELDQVRRIAGAELSLEAIGRLLQAWIDQDRKAPPLKSLQGMLWQEGYQAGEIKGQVYPDAARALRKWQQAGLPLYIYSSGSVQAQKLLFQHSEHGDLSGLFSGYFDLAVGGKMEADSYVAIARAMVLPPRAILFVSDVRQELDAAREAGLQTLWMLRQGEPPEGGAHPWARDFAEIRLLLP